MFGNGVPHTSRAASVTSMSLTASPTAWLIARVHACRDARVRYIESGRKWQTQTNHKKGRKNSALMFECIAKKNASSGSHQDKEVSVLYPRSHLNGWDGVRYLRVAFLSLI